MDTDRTAGISPGIECLERHCLVTRLAEAKNLLAPGICVHLCSSVVWGAACTVDDRNAAELICMVAFPHVQSLSQRTGSLLAILSGCPEFSRPISWHFPTRGGMRGSWCLFLFLTNCLLIAFNKTQAGPISSSFFTPRRRWGFAISAPKIRGIIRISVEIAAESLAFGAVLPHKSAIPERAAATWPPSCEEAW